MGSVLLMIGCFFGGLYFIATGYYKKVRTRRTQRWPTVTGKILESFVDSDKDKFYPRMTYQYEVNGRRYESTRIAFGDLRTPNRIPAEQVVDNFSTGTEITVRYNPAKPEEAVLSMMDKRADSSNDVSIICGCVLLIIVLLIGIGLYFGG